jgi:hypothetical protein
MASTLADLRITLKKELRLEDRFASALFRTEELINELIRCPPETLSASLIEAYRQSRETVAASDDILRAIEEQRKKTKNTALNEPMRGLVLSARSHAVKINSALRMAKEGPARGFEENFKKHAKGPFEDYLIFLQQIESRLEEMVSLENQELLSIEHTKSIVHAQLEFINACRTVSEGLLNITAQIRRKMLELCRAVMLLSKQAGIKEEITGNPTLLLKDFSMLPEAKELFYLSEALSYGVELMIQDISHSNMLIYQYKEPLVFANLKEIFKKEPEKIELIKKELHSIKTYYHELVKELSTLKAVDVIERPSTLNKSIVLVNEIRWMLKRESGDLRRLLIEVAVYAKT